MGLLFYFSGEMGEDPNTLIGQLGKKKKKKRKEDPASFSFLLINETYSTLPESLFSSSIISALQRYFCHKFKIRRIRCNKQTGIDDFANDRIMGYP
jgi:hypothetical protein